MDIKKVLASISIATLVSGTGILTAKNLQNEEIIIAKSG